jgi:hypothetical protein
MPVFRATGWAVLSGCLLLGGCGSPAPISKNTERQPAHLVVMNLTDYRWRITIARLPAPPTADFQVEARESRSIDLAGGEYTIRQTVLSEGAASELSRELPAKFESGENYRWRLATLLSEAADPAPSP